MLTMLASAEEAFGGLMGALVSAILMVALVYVVVKGIVNTSQNTEQIKDQLMKNNASNYQAEIATQQSPAPKENNEEKQALLIEAKLKDEIQKLQKDKDRLIFLITTISRKLAESSFADKCQGLLKHIDTILEEIERK